MSMHIDKSLNTTSFCKRKTKITKAQQADLERGWRERNIFLRNIGLAKETFEQYLEWVYGKGKKEKTKKYQSKLCTTPIKESSDNKEKLVEHMSTNENKNNMAKWVPGPCSSKPSPIYTGKEIVGIATMHKSNMVPVFSQTEAEEISKMRR